MTSTPDPLAARLTVVLSDAQRRYRSQRGWGALAFPPFPPDQLVEVAQDLVPFLRELVVEVVEALRAQEATR